MNEHDINNFKALIRGFKQNLELGHHDDALRLLVLVMASLFITGALLVFIVDFHKGIL